MSREEAQQHYPSAVEAVLVHENVEMVSSIFPAARLSGTSPDKLWEAMVNSSLKANKAVPEGKTITAKIAAQIATEDFKR